MSSLSSSSIPSSEFAHHPLLVRLLELHKIPKELFIRGKLPHITMDEYGRLTPRILTIVGSRKCTSYGKRVIEKLLEGFSSHEVIVISGLAYGIDETAHNVALKKKLMTIAIPGSGLDEASLYPSEHRTLATSILTSSGLLISELSDGTKAAQWTFPARNRIMAALSDAVLIIEGEEKSGTLITGRQALELGKDIGAVPGDIFSSHAAGPLQLIRDGATPITSHNDLRELLHLPLQEPLTEEAKEIPFTQEEKIIIDILTNPLPKESLLVMSKLPVELFLSTYTLLEIKGHIEESFGEVRRLV
jgi:DNA processing protein